ncbi:MAG TPA: DUF3560 domain-containing protein [Kribbellaceae bacterium]|nr:DUF3560 domain-containing protein [Kribbellaceae bacterium]
MITVEHSHAEGTVVYGTTRSDGTNLVFRSIRDGWRFSRNIGADGAWYLPQSRDRNADRTRIERLAEALHAAGFPVETSIDDTPRPAAQIEADREARVAGRVQRYTELADARHEGSGARLDHVRDRRSHIPLGQPVISDRYAGFLRRLNRTEDSARAEAAVGDHWQHRADAAASTQRYRHNPRVITRRIERLEADLRRWQRARDTVASGGTHGEYTDGGQYAENAPDYLSRADAEIARLGEQITHWREVLAAMQATGAHRAWTREHFRVGDEARILGTWYPVVRVNAKSLTVPPLVFGGQRRFTDAGKDVWTDTAPYDKVYGRRRHGNVLHSPPPPADATCVIALPVETVDQQDLRLCPKPPVARRTIRHDGTSCGCVGLCQTSEPEAASQVPNMPWTQTILLCAEHATDRRSADREAGLQPPAVTWEDLT